MTKAIPRKSDDDIKDHYNILIEDINAIESGYVPLPNYPEIQNQNSKVHVEWREGLLGQNKNTCIWIEEQSMDTIEQKGTRQLKERRKERMWIA
ncbi:hypothetical protein MTR67_048132 [Solanum verrucosum]|uniref:Uncharacterized protein n=1 Tax=Solanum verrucosum TaxID=315347 RepID=A0AAF0UYB6_SOLVR|nr:hypothetical protein MTR67_048132 [Solanum verrucosum]